MRKAAGKVSFCGRCPLLILVDETRRRTAPLTCFTEGTGVAWLAHAGERANTLYTHRIVDAGAASTLVNVCNNTQTHRDRHSCGIFTQLINISATLLPSLCKYALLAVKGIREGLIHLRRLDGGNRPRQWWKTLLQNVQNYYYFT